MIDWLIDTFRSAGEPVIDERTIDYPATGEPASGDFSGVGELEPEPEGGFEQLPPPPLPPAAPLSAADHLLSLSRDKSVLLISAAEQAFTSSFTWTLKVSMF